MVILHPHQFLFLQEFLPGSYVSEDGDYNSDGWLSGQDFVGAAATASRFVVGFGQCSVNTKCFGVSHSLNIILLSDILARNLATSIEHL